MRKNRVYEKNKVHFVVALCKEGKRFAGEKLLGELVDYRGRKGGLESV